MYLWLAGFVRRGPAVCGAIVYMLVPYHVVVDLYNRAALAETWAFVWMPLVLYGVLKFSQSERRISVGIAIGFALLMLFTLVDRSALFLGAAGLCFCNCRKIHPLVRRTQSGCLADARGRIIGDILLPAAFHKPHISTERDIERDPS